MARDRAARPEAKPLRLFVAVDLSEKAREAVVRAIDPWRALLPKGRWVEPENWHVTLKFLGRTWPRLLAAVEESCRDAAAGAAPFEVGLGGLGVFPGPSRARVLWAGLEDPAEGLAGLAGALDERLAAEFPPEKRGFTAHLTVARFNPPVPVREHVDSLAATPVDAPTSRIDRLVLYRSHLSPRGARYESLTTFPFGA